MNPAIKILAEELALPEYAEASDKAAADIVNAKTVAKKRLVDIADAVTFLRECGAWYAIKKAANDNPAAYAAVDLVEDLRAQTINMDNPMVQQMGAGLVMSGLMTQEQWDGVTALGIVQAKWTQEMCGLPFVTDHDIKTARAG